MKQLKKEVVKIVNKEEPSNEPKAGISKFKSIKYFEPIPITATLDQKTFLNESDTERIKKKMKFKKILPTKKKMTHFDINKIFPRKTDITSSSIFSSSVDNLNVSANTFELSDHSKSSPGLSVEAETCNEAAKTAKIVVFGSFINVSF